jgi:hypothetical protein
MPPKKKTTRASRATKSDNTQKLEMLIRESVHSEISTQQSHKNATDAYIQRLHDTDARVTEFIQQAINETTHAYRLSIYSLFIGHLVAFFLMFGGLLLAILTINKLELFIIALLFIAISVIWTINLQNRNLSKNNRSLVNSLAKLNIIFAGYLRQIHQIDALFEELLRKGDGITVQDVEQLLNNLQDAVAEAMSAITTTNIESDD